MPLRRLSIAVKDKVRIKLEQMVDQGIIVQEPEPSLWISALIVVTKPNGDIRICIDPKPLNKALRRNHYPLPTIDDVIPDLKQAKVFSTIDAKDGFWHVELDEESSKLTTFLTPLGNSVGCVYPAEFLLLRKNFSGEFMEHLLDWRRSPASRTIFSSMAVATTLKKQQWIMTKNWQRYSTDVAWQAFD